ncbi:hypothetical protein C5167_007559 [Papaver somniferum]|nr:hypothetical protein C5167_007559 [Papaver somniferum]
MSVVKEEDFCSWCAKEEEEWTNKEEVDNPAAILRIPYVRPTGILDQAQRWNQKSSFRGISWQCEAI